MPPVAIACDDNSTSSSFSVKDVTMMKPPAVIQSRNRVQFVEDLTIHEFDGVDEELCGEVWYTKEEFDIIKSRNSLIVKMMKIGSFEESDEHSFRGLEHKLKAGFKQRRENKFNALNAVLEEQDRQFHRGITNPEAIAEAYRRIALNAKENAFVLAFRDTEESYSFRSHASTRQITPVFSAAKDEEEQITVPDDETDADTMCSEASTMKRKSRFGTFLKKVTLKKKSGSK